MKITKSPIRLVPAVDLFNVWSAQIKEQTFMVITLLIDGLAQDKW